jgi:uncharacterized protein (TIGR02246 family)
MNPFVLTSGRAKSSHLATEFRLLREIPEDRIMTDDERAIRELLTRWVDATKRGDTEAVLNLMTDDVVFMVPGREPFGKEAFQRASDDMRGTRIDGTSDIRELRVLEGWAFIRTQMSVTMTPPDGASITRSGYTLTILRKEADRRWRLARDANLLTVQR